MEIKSTITSKGQVTLPKTIREIMNLNSGDQVIFKIQEGNKVILEKEAIGVKQQALVNLIDVLTEKHSLIIIKGGSGFGKTFFTKNLLINIYRDQKVAVINANEEGYAEIIDSMPDFKNLKTDNNDIFSDISKTNYDLLVVDLLDDLDFEAIKKLNELKNKMILVSQDLHVNELHELGSHLSITFSHNGMNIETYELENDNFLVTPLFIQ